MKGFHYLKGVATLALAADACVGCGRCEEVCPHSVLVVEERRARVQNLDRCMECGACARNCPSGALRVDAGVGCATGLLTEWFRERKLRLSSGSCCG